MNHHLSDEQIGSLLAGHGADSERQHLAECGRCRTQVEELRAAVLSFRHAVRERVDGYVERRPPAAWETESRRKFPLPHLVWGVAVAVVLALLFVPAVVNRPHSPEIAPAAVHDPEAFMKEIDIHLLRTAPAPMAPMFALVPDAPILTEPGGTQ